MDNNPMATVPPNEVPKEYVERCQKGELGGVMLIFLNAKNTDEMNAKVKDVHAFAKRMKKKYPSLTGVHHPKKLKE